MSAAFIVPFNEQPYSISVKTGSYTIPAGYYARAIVNLEGSATFTIDAVTAIRGTQSTLASTGPSIAIGSAANSLQAVSGAGAGTHDWTSTTDQKAVIAEIRLPTGTVINGTGTWRAVVELYPMIS